jgi:hypothetical protein
MVWMVILNILMNDGSLYTDVHFPNDPQYNNEKDCNEAGQALVDQKQLEIGTNAGKTYFICKPITADDIKAATQKPGQNI